VRQCTGKVKERPGVETSTWEILAVLLKLRPWRHHSSCVAKGHVHAQTGGVELNSTEFPRREWKTGAGGIVVKFVKTGAPASDSKLETSAGDITVYIAPDVALSVRASVDLGNGHHITSDFPDIHVASEGDKWGPRTLNAEGNLNGGGRC